MYSRGSFNKVYNIVKPKSCTVVVPKSINIYFMLQMCLSGFDFGYKKTLSNCFRKVFNYIQVCVAITMCALLIRRVILIKIDWYMALGFLFEYLSQHALLLFSKYNVYDLIMDVHT